jgi:outer membrane receptor protein involved in Fe transport
LNENYDKTQHRGFEISTDWQALKNLGIKANFTYNEAFSDGGSFDKKQLPAVPYNKSSLTATWKILPQLRFDGSFNYVGKQFFISDQGHNFPKMDDYWTVNVKLSYAISNAELFVGINNLFNEKYSEFGAISVIYNEPGVNPAPERNFIIGGSIKF